MRTRNRCVGFDCLEQLALLSTVHPALGHGPHAAQSGPKLPAYVLAVEHDSANFGSHVSEQTIVAPGSFTSYQITFQVKDQTYTVDITIPAPPTPGPQPA